MTRPDTGSAAVPDASTVIVVASTADNPHNDVMRLLRDVLIPHVRLGNARSKQLGG